VLFQSLAGYDEQIAQAGQGALVPVSAAHPGYRPEAVKPGILPFRVAVILAYRRQAQG